MSLFKLWRSRTAADAARGPDDRTRADAAIAEGHAREDAGDLDGARSRYEAAIALAPGYWRAHLNLGNAFRAAGAAEQAILCYRKAVELAPEEAAAHLNLGNALMDAGRARDAAQSYRTAAGLRRDWSAPRLGYASAVAPDDPAAAEAALREALAIEPASGAIAARLATLLDDGARHDEALQVVDDALARTPGDFHALVARASFCSAAGDAEGAVDAYRRALQAKPDRWDTWSAYLFAMNFLAHASAQELLAEHRRFGECIAHALPARPAVPSGGADKRLRIAYLSPDFRAHPVANFIAPVLRHHDRARFDVHCFQLDPRSDAVTAGLRALAPHWHEAYGLGDAALEQRLRDNGIDILVDLAGHTSGNRLPVLARKPAPLQFTWLGYLCTTGMTTVDYRLCDAVTDPPGSPPGSEQVAPLPHTQWCYEPLRALPAIGELPYRRNGFWTFGSFNQGSKLGRELLQCWARLLRRVPHSRLRIVGVVNGRLARTIAEVFASAGIDAERVDIVGRLPVAQYMDAYNTVDVAFDSHPYSGATTTCDALVMGVPVATATGDRGITRSTASLLRACGLEHWVAPSMEALPDLVCDTLSAPDAIARLRATLRDRLAGSPVMDGAAFTRSLEDTFLETWRDCVGRESPSRSLGGA